MTDAEIERLDTLRGDGTSRPSMVRQLIRAGLPVQAATRDEALTILSSLARDGRVSAAVALERALRIETGTEGDLLDNILGEGGEKK